MGKSCTRTATAVARATDAGKTPATCAQRVRSARCAIDAMHLSPRRVAGCAPSCSSVPPLVTSSNTGVRATSLGHATRRLNQTTVIIVSFG